MIQSTAALPVHLVTAVLPSGQKTTAVDPVELQHELLRFADNLLLSTSKSIEQLSVDQVPISRSDLLTIQLGLSTEVYGLVSGENALANLIGLTILLSEGRQRLEDYWRPKVYGHSADLLIKAFKEREREIWNITERVLSQEMQDELHQAIDAWKREYRGPTGDVGVYASSTLVGDVTKGFQKNAGGTSPSGVFALLNMDPLASLDPATRELTQTRLFAERALFIGQRLPQLIEWQLETLAIRSAQIPQVTQMVDSSSQIAGSSERLSRSIESLPAFLASEREKILKTVSQERAGLTVLAQATQASFTAGAQMARDTRETIQSIDDFSRRLASEPSDPGAPPFDIRDWGKTAVEISALSTELQGLLNRVQTISEKKEIAELSEAFKDAGVALITHAVKSILFLFTLCGFIAMLIRLSYHWLMKWLNLN